MWHVFIVYVSLIEFSVRGNVVLSTFSCEQIYCSNLYNSQNTKRKTHTGQTPARQPLFPFSNVLMCPAPIRFHGGHYTPLRETNQVTNGKTSPAWVQQVMLGPGGSRRVIIPHSLSCRDPRL